MRTISAAMGVVIAGLMSIFAGALASLRAGDLAFSDPARLPPPPPHAVGFPSRDPDLDALPGFRKPPPGYGEVPFFWWLGDPVTHERLTWELDQFRGVPVAGMQINYAHTDRGGRSFGLTFPSDPPLFSEDWWNLFHWFLGEARQRGMAASLSDYTLAGPGQGWWTDEIIREDPAIGGSVLKSAVKDAPGGTELTWTVPTNALSVVAFRTQNGAIVPGSGVDLGAMVADNTLHWQPPAGAWRIIAVGRERVPFSLDPMNPRSGKQYVAKFFQRFEDRNPGEGGHGLDFFFSDELNLGVSGKMWTDDFAGEFRRRKGYDLRPELAALFADLGPRTVKVRLDYSDVLVALEEERFFRPLFEWHYSRGMVFGCDHGGRGRDVVEFGDYFRTQRWMTGPGNDQPRLASDIVKTKVASSISHLYQRPRAWLEGYYGSGWGTTPADLTDATYRNFVLGHNLLTLHGLYYTLHGGYWEWAPPCNHFRMPYWPHLVEFLRCAERLSYLLSQGVHRCDVAVLYPVAPMEAGLGGREAVDAAFAVGPQLFNRAIDFDFMDFESLARAEVRDRELCVSGEKYRVLILPAMRALRFSTLQKALEFHRAGGTVIAIGALPEASDHAGADDAELDGMVKEIFGATALDPGAPRDLPVNRSSTGGVGVLFADAKSAVDYVGRTLPPDFAVSDETAASRPAQVLHRKIGPRDVFMVLGVSKGAECYFRAKGRVELWDPWTGATRPLFNFRPDANGIYVAMPLASGEAQLIVFTPGTPEFALERNDLPEVAAVERDGEKVVVRGFATTAGTYQAEVRHGEMSVRLRGEAVAPPPALALDGPWEFELKPTLDNRWGDFRLPASDSLIGPEARRFRYADEVTPNPDWQSPGLDDSKWPEITCSFGPQFWKLGPLPDDVDTAAIEAKLAGLKAIDPAVPLETGGRKFTWQPDVFSWRWGVEGDPGHEGYHGLKESVSDEFIALGKVQFTGTGSTYQKEPGGSRYYLWTAAVSQQAGEARVLTGGLKPVRAWLNGAPLPPAAGPEDDVPVNAGANPLLLRYDQPGRGYFVLRAANIPEPSARAPLAMRWYQDPGVMGFDLKPAALARAGWYRFTSPPGLRSMKFTAAGPVRAWADGVEMALQVGALGTDGMVEYEATTAQVEPGPVSVAVRVEQPPGRYAGVAIPDPVTLDCVAGQAELGDWSKQGALATYSGGAWYRRTFSLTPAQAQSQITLQLGGVAASAEVWLNGQRVGIRVAPPWTVDLSKFARSGDNRLEILVYNTLANQYRTIPTRYRGEPTSGLLGPVRIEFASPVVLRAGP